MYISYISIIYILKPPIRSQIRKRKDENGKAEN